MIINLPGDGLILNAGKVVIADTVGGDEAIK